MSLDNQHIEFQELIAKYLSGAITEQEKNVLNNWCETNSENNKMFDEISKAWKLSKINKDIAELNVDAEWSKLKSNIFKTKNTVTLQSSEIIKKQSPIKLLYRIAAIFIILALSLTIWHYYTNQDSTKNLMAFQGPNEVVLPDGSVITLNNSTKLKYPKSFAKDKRQVFLENGEAYFEITHNKTKPFVISSGEIKIEVIGTSFNVNTTTKDNSIVVTVNTGKVAVYRAENENEKIFLQAGEKGIFQKDKKKLEKTINTDENYNSWKTKKIVFKNKTLKSVIKTLNKNYNSNINIDKEIENCRYTATFDNLSLNAILTILESTLDITIQKKENSIEIKEKAD